MIRLLFNTPVVVPITLCKGNFSGYDQLQLSDEPNECFIRDSKGRRRLRKIRDSSVPQLFLKTDTIREVMIVVKEVDVEKLTLRETSYSPFTPGGYLSSFLEKSLSKMGSVKTLNVHIDMMIENFKNICLPCPMEDLFFALEHLSGASFETFIQISLCCAEFNESDVFTRNFLISGMEKALKAAHQREAEGQFVVEPLEGYVDITVQKGNVEYSFAFFYYNPSICDATEDDVDEGNEENGENEENEKNEEDLDSLSSLKAPIAQCSLKTLGKRENDSPSLTPSKKSRLDEELKL
ncbi:unnamed protein product, partial [Mesorhabditis belari]|uniref:Uncharacterized protein n=1 Tax=Mesorhabditis belari TaxID=2138241 RepID=A0AAF3FD00_9BILA